MKQLFTPNGKRIIGTAETLKGVANVTGFTDTGAPIFQGSTTVDWDSQLTRCNARGQEIMVDEDGDEWPKDVCKLVEDTADTTN
jgi:hypothetical protein